VSKRPSLAESMRQIAEAPDAVVPQSPRVSPPVVTAHERLPESSGRERRFYAATRAGKKKVTATLAPSDHKRLRQLALERDATTEALLTEAISDLFAKYGKAEIGQGREAS
jgi:hypothetical protein